MVMGPSQSLRHSGNFESLRNDARLRVHFRLFESSAAGVLKSRAIGQTSEVAVCDEAAIRTDLTGFLGRVGEMMLGRAPGA